MTVWPNFARNTRPFAWLMVVGLLAACSSTPPKPSPAPSQPSATNPKNAETLHFVLPTQGQVSYRVGGKARKGIGIGGAAGATVVATITYAPTAATSAAAAFTVTTNVGVATTSLTGTGKAAPAVSTATPANGQIGWALTDTQSDALTARAYVFDIIENAGTASERTIIEGTLAVSGRATP